MDTDPNRLPLFDELMAKIDDLPEQQQTEATMELVTILMNAMKPEQIRAMRAEFVQEMQRYFWSTCEEDTSDVLDLMDGHLALRELLDPVPRADIGPGQAA